MIKYIMCKHMRSKDINQFEKYDMTAYALLELYISYVSNRRASKRVYVILSSKFHFAKTMLILLNLAYLR